MERETAGGTKIKHASSACDSWLYLWTPHFDWSRSDLPSRSSSVAEPCKFSWLCVTNQKSSSHLFATAVLTDPSLSMRAELQIAISSVATISEPTHGQTQPIDCCYVQDRGLILTYGGIFSSLDSTIRPTGRCDTLIYCD